jgi:hypothetical protein
MRKAILAALLLMVGGCSFPPAMTTARPAEGTSAQLPPPPAATSDRPVEGPSAQQLADGRWLRIPSAPIRLCDPQAVWDGRDLVVIEPAFPPCPPGAAAYDPRANSWAKIATPPRFIGVNPATAWGGGRLMLISERTGAAATWDPVTARWQQLAPVPSPGVVSAVWTGDKFLVITASAISSSKGSAHVFALTGSRWRRLPDLPQPASGRIVSAVAAAGPDAVYALATINPASTSHGGANADDTSNLASVELVRLGTASWRPVPLSSVVPQSQLALTAVNGGILAAGSSCPALAICTLEDGTAALLRMGAQPDTIPLMAPAGVPYPYDIAAGSQAIVVTYQNGLGTPLPPGAGPVPGSSTIYDIATGKWQPGPTAAGSGSSFGAYWTAYGVVCLGQPSRTTLGSAHKIGGWLLRPN